jgi:hypothetical protein
MDRVSTAHLLASLDVFFESTYRTGSHTTVEQARHRLDFSSDSMQADNTRTQYLPLESVEELVLNEALSRCSLACRHERYPSVLRHIQIRLVYHQMNLMKGNKQVLSSMLTLTACRTKKALCQGPRRTPAVTHQ